MSTSVMIREATAEDIPAIVALLEELSREEQREDSATLEALRAAMLSEVRRVALAASVAVADGQVVATVLYYPGYDVLTNAYGYHLSDIIVARAHRRCGIGKALMQHLAQKNLGEGGEWISLTTPKQNLAARDFYAGLGMIDVPIKFFASGKTILQRMLKK